MLYYSAGRWPETEGWGEPCFLHSSKMALIWAGQGPEKIKGWGEEEKKNQKKNGNSSQNCPWLMSSVFQCFNIGFQLAQTLISDQSLLDLHCNTVQLRPALGSVPWWTTPCSAALPETLIFTFYLPKTMSGNRKMMKQSLSLLCEAKGLLKITIWGKVVLQLHLLCTE